jgi:hypothetical protein
MRTLPIALVAGTLTISSPGFSQDQGLVGGKVGPCRSTSCTNAAALLGRAGRWLIADLRASRPVRALITRS